MFDWYVRFKTDVTIQPHEKDTLVITNNIENVLSLSMKLKYVA